MRLLTVKQPWAWSILHAGKTIENRSVPWSYRGPLAIHAGKGWDEAGTDHPEYTDALASATSKDRRRIDTTGAVIGMVQLVDAHDTRPPSMVPARSGCCDSPWADMTATAHLVLADPVVFDTPIPAVGRLGLWRPDVDLAARLVAATDAHVENQLTITDAIAEAEALRDEGMARTTAAADDQDINVIDQAIAHLNAQQARWSANDLRELLPEVRQPLIGARINAAANRRQMRKVDEVKSTLASTHAKKLAVWVGVAAEEAVSA